MEITDIKIRKIAHEEKLKAIISVTFDNQLAVHDIKIIDGNQKLFVAMPSRKNQLGEYKDIVHPINASTRDYIQSALIDAYLNELERMKQEKEQEASVAAEELQ